MLIILFLAGGTDYEKHNKNADQTKSLYSAFAGPGSLLLMRGFQIFAKRK